MERNGSDGALPDCVPWYHHGAYPADPAWGTAYTFLLDWMMQYYGESRPRGAHVCTKTMV